MVSMLVSQTIVYSVYPTSCDHSLLDTALWSYNDLRFTHKTFLVILFQIQMTVTPESQRKRWYGRCVSLSRVKYGQKTVQSDVNVL